MDNSSPPLSDDEARQRARQERKARRHAERLAQRPQAPAPSPWTSTAPSPRPSQGTISTPTPAETVDGAGPQRRQQAGSSGGYNPIVKKVGRMAGNMLLKQVIKLVLGRLMR
jgi:hypothetical protein